MTQSIREKIRVGGFADRDGKDQALLQAVCHPTEATLAKEILATLYNTYPIYWDIEFQDSTINVWCGLHPTFGFRVDYMDLNKGYSIFRKMASELVERLKYDH